MSLFDKFRALGLSKKAAKKAAKKGQEEREEDVMSTFSKGDRVRVIDVEGQDPQRTLVLSLGEIHTIEDVTRHGWPRFGGYDWLPERFEKVEPEGADEELADWERALLAEVDAEDTDDVEPEPQFNDDDVTHLKVTAGSDVIFDGLAVFEEADNGNVIVTPVPRCTSLFNRPKTSEIVRCGQHEGHSHGHWTIGSHPATSWGDAMQYGRLVESDGAS